MRKRSLKKEKTILFRFVKRVSSFGLFLKLLFMWIMEKRINPTQHSRVNGTFVSSGSRMKRLDTGTVPRLLMVFCRERTTQWVGGISELACLRFHFQGQTRFDPKSILLGFFCLFVRLFFIAPVVQDDKKSPALLRASTFQACLRENNNLNSATS